MGCDLGRAKGLLIFELLIVYAGRFPMILRLLRLAAASTGVKVGLAADEGVTEFLAETRPLASTMKPKKEQCFSVIETTFD